MRYLLFQTIIHGFRMVIDILRWAFTAFAPIQQTHRSVYIYGQTGRKSLEGYHLPVSAHMRHDDGFPTDI